jgi:uncharacterized protein (DUF488 family)
VPLPFFTIGHSTRSIAEFTALLETAEVKSLADVRTIPRSRTNPQFNADVLPDSLRPIEYTHIAALGGLRGRRRDETPSPNTFWENQSFRNYADYAATPAFCEGLAQLRAIGRERRCAIMCAEAVWWRCHRRIIADYLLSEGEQVFHIMGPDRIEPAKLTPAAHRIENGTLIYSA